MIWRLFTIVIFAALMFGGYLWLNQYLPNVGWVHRHNDTWSIVSSGWDTVRYLWPITLAGMIVGVIVSSLFWVYLYANATDADYAAHIARLTDQKQAAEQAVATADARAYALFTAQREKLNQEQQTLHEARLAIDHEKAVLAKTVHLAKQAIIEAQTKQQAAEKAAEHAHRKKERASFALKKYRQKHPKS